MEEFKRIRGYDKYYISDKGRVLSLSRGKSKFLKTPLDRYGYKKVTLCKNSKRLYTTVHRLVAENFLDNPNNLPQVNHEDGNKENNSKENLKWCDSSYNHKHAYRIGLKVPISGEKHYKSNLNSIQIKEIRERLKEGEVGTKIAKDYDVSKQTISKIKTNKHYKDE